MASRRAEKEARKTTRSLSWEDQIRAATQLIADSYARVHSDRARVRSCVVNTIKEAFEGDRPVVGTGVILGQPAGMVSAAGVYRSVFAAARIDWRDQRVQETWFAFVVNEVDRYLGISA